MSKISWVDRVRNEVLERMGLDKRMIKAIRKKQLKFVGRIIREEGLENLILTG